MLEIHICLNPLKCVLYVTAGCLLGFIVSQSGITIDPLKVQAIAELPPPPNTLCHYKVYNPNPISFVGLFLTTLLLHMVFYAFYVLTYPFSGMIKLTSHSMH